MSLRAHLADEAQPRLPLRPKARMNAEDHARQHPEVYETLRRLALERVEAGARRLGMKALWERARWEESPRRAGRSGYAYDNNVVSGYARLLADREPALRDVFEFRERRA